MADNKVVIKINYDKDKYRKALIDPKMVTVWHTRRILSFLMVLLLLVYAIYRVFSGENNSDDVKQSNETMAPSVAESIRPVDDIQRSAMPVVPQHVKAAEQMPVGTRSEAASDKISEIKRPAAIIFDARVIRASLNTVLKNGEPVDSIKLPVLIERSQTLELFYFSQIKNMKNNVLFHRWYKDGQLVQKKQFAVNSNNAKLVSSRKFTENDVGQWRVVLVNNKGSSLSEVNYSVRH